MNEWTIGYRAALADVARLTLHRNPEAAMPVWLGVLLTELQQDALVRYGVPLRTESETVERLKRVFAEVQP